MFDKDKVLRCIDEWFEASGDNYMEDPNMYFSDLKDMLVRAGVGNKIIEDLIKGFKYTFDAVSPEKMNEQGWPPRQEDIYYNLINKEGLSKEVADIFLEFMKK